MPSASEVIRWRRSGTEARPASRGFWMQLAGRRLLVWLLLALAIGAAAGWLVRRSGWAEPVETRARQTMEDAIKRARSWLDEK